MTTWRVGVWCAVSSKPQASQEKESLPAQEAVGREFTSAIGGEVIRIYTVPGHSRDYVFWQEAEKEMPAYRQVREDLEAGRVDVIHCVDSDRLGRDPALVQQFYSLAERHSCEVYDASMPHQLGQAHVGHRYGVAVKSVSAGEDQRRRIARQASGVKGRVKRGLPPLSRWPVGYRVLRDERGRCVGAEFNADIGAIEMVTRLFLDQLSYSCILDAAARSPWSMPGGRDWSYSFLRRIVYNDLYAGFVHWGDTRNDKPSSYFPALWDAQTYAAVLRERERRKSQYIRPQGGPLCGIAYCARCGWAMGRVMRVNRPGEYYIRCAKRAKGLGCHPNTIDEGAVLSALSDWLSSLNTPERLDAVLRQDPGPDKLEAERDRLVARLEELEEGRKRLALALAAGQMRPAIYYDADQVLDSERIACTKRLGELGVLLASRPDLSMRRAYLEQVIARRIADPTNPATRLALRRAGVRIYCEDRRVILIGFAM